MARREPTLLDIELPYSGTIEPGLRRRASALLRWRIVDGRRIRGAAIMVGADHVSVAIAGSPDP